MELIRLINNNFKFDTPLAVTIGQFDGIHLGHLSLLNKTLEVGKLKKYKTAVITFYPHPDLVLMKNSKNSYLLNFEEKKNILSKLGFDYLIIIDFNLDIANMAPQEFTKKFLIKQNVKEVIVGKDFVFGKNGSASGNDIAQLSNNLINTIVMDEIKVDNKKISSSKIKFLLLEGKVFEAKNMLGRYYSIEGIVGYGNQIGNKIDVPTANLEYDSKYALLKKGVYATAIKVDNELYCGITNYGNNPSFNYSKTKTLETHILDFSKNIYGSKMRVYFIKYLRDEIKFSSIDDFKSQIKKDINSAKKIFLDVKECIDKF